MIQGSMPISFEGFYGLHLAKRETRLPSTFSPTGTTIFTPTPNSTTKEGKNDRENGFILTFTKRTCAP